MKILELGHVVLYVTNLEQSRKFYRNILGFREIGARPGMVIFSSGRTHHELLLIEVGGKPTQKPGVPRPGLYHIGFKIGETDEKLNEAIEELKKHKVEIVGTADHHVTHSVYILDPDGNELELYVDISDDWKRDPQSILR